jgi:hypothetical protein
MNWRAALMLATLTVPVGAEGVDVMNSVGELRAMLLEARSLPLGTKTHYRCPDWQWRTIGMPREVLLDALPEPDYKEKEVVFYFLTAPRPSGQRGGGFPEVTVYFKKDGTVETIRCNYSR